MARELHQPHDNLFRKVFSEEYEAAGLLYPILRDWLISRMNRVDVDATGSQSRRRGAGGRPV